VLASVFNLLGPLLLGAAVANTIAKIVEIPGGRQDIIVIGAGLTGAVTWNFITWWRGIPSSSAHALIGGLVGAAIVEVGASAVNWGGMDGIHPVGVLGTLIAMAVAPIIGFGAALLLARIALRGLRRGSRRLQGPVSKLQWPTSAWLAFSHGSNDASKAVGIIFALQLARNPDVTSSSTWAKVGCAVALTLGTAIGGWRIVRTIGRRIFRLRPLDGLASQTSSAGVIFGASLIGAPVSTTQVVSSSVVGIGAARRRYGHIGWNVVKEILIAWVTTMPAAALLAVVSLPLWRWVV
jgi:PiT family inorganic phosphate transporter